MNPGDQLRDYILEAHIGEGGMAEVWRAQHAHLGTTAALKIMASGGRSEADFADRFLKEARAMAALRHPSILGAVDFFSDQGRYVLVLPYMDGGSLEDLLLKTGGPLPIPKALAISGQILSALDFAHQKGIIHRDVKPSNILLDQEGNAFLADFGIAIIMGEDRRTRTGTSIGTPHYMSPEQIARPKTMDHRSDVYSLGCVLYEMLTGRPPFNADKGDEGDTDFFVKDGHLRGEVPDPGQSNRSIPGWLRQVVMKSLDKDPAKRYPGCGAFAQVLREGAAAAAPLPQPRPVTPLPSPAAPVAPPPAQAGPTPARLPAATPALAPAPAPSPSQPTGWRNKGPILALVGVLGLLAVVGLMALARQAPGGSAISKRLAIELVRIPAGQFTMGSETNGDEKPPHTVTFQREFHMGKTEVTQAQWVAVMGSNPSNFKGDDRPVERVSWNDAQEFLRKLNALEGRSGATSYRLPTEAEWEYACRAGTTGDHAGDLDAMAWYDKTSGGTTHPVGQKQANAWGLQDMHGNVWEWCEDSWHDNYSGAPTDGSAWTSGGDSTRRVLRGGSWSYSTGYCRSAIRPWSGPTNRNFNIGFRVVVDAPSRTP